MNNGNFEGFNEEEVRKLINTIVNIRDTTWIELNNYNSDYRNNLFDESTGCWFGQDAIDNASNIAEYIANISESFNRLLSSMIVNVGRSANAWFIRNDMPKIEIDEKIKKYADDDAKYSAAGLVPVTYAHMKNTKGYTGMNTSYVLAYTETYIKKTAEAVNKALEELPTEISLYDREGDGVAFQFANLKNEIKKALLTNVGVLTKLINKCIQEGVDNIRIASKEVSDNMIA